MIVSFKPKIREIYNAFCSVSESNKQSPQDRSLDLPFFLQEKHITSRQNHISLAQGESMPYWLWVNFCGLVCFDLPFREFNLSAVTNCFESGCQLKKLVAIVLQNLSLFL